MSEDHAVNADIAGLPPSIYLPSSSKVEHRTVNANVAGSSPASAAININKKRMSNFASFFLI